MSATDTGPEPTNTAGPLSRDDLLDVLDTALASCEHKIDSGRIRDPEREDVRIRWIKALVSVVKEYRLTLGDLEDAREIEAKVRRLESLAEQRRGEL